MSVSGKIRTSKKHKILITAGPTVEPLDPIRYLSNYSTGEMGYAISSESVKRGHEVCLISGPVKIKPPQAVRLVNIKTAEEMSKEVKKRVRKYDCIMMTAAVCDFRPQRLQKDKIKKNDFLELKLEKNPDILLELRDYKNLVKVGFALETKNLIKNGRQKLKNKNLDIIVLNEKRKNKDPFGSGAKEYVMLTARDNQIKRIKKISKKEMAKIILKETERILELQGTDE
ncbi:MAG: phosphopantothenoylcysteine decarboxylase [Candidatus Omnitrophota bacterium]|nr:phosphopantothenoylcysteine decarboxylase [Candidatus Omnitrophota bacterium]